MSLKSLDPNHNFDEINEELWQYVFTRDNGLCQVCGGAGHEEHHIIYRSRQKGQHRANNLILLCKKHHTMEHSVNAKPREYYEKRVLRNETTLRKNLV